MYNDACHRIRRSGDFTHLICFLTLSLLPLAACSDHAGSSISTSSATRTDARTADGGASDPSIPLSGGAASQSSSAGDGGAAGNAGAAANASAAGDGSTAGNAGDAGAIEPACTGTLEFTHHAVDDTFTGDEKALGDLNGDGLLDVIVGGPGARWYEAPSWAIHDVGGSGGWLTSHMQTADINGDGAVDIVSPDGHDLYWFENPRGSGGSVDDDWSRHLIGSRDPLTHELIVVDLNHDGNLDLVVNPSLQAWIQGSEPTSWTAVDLSAFSNVEGLAVGRVDEDDTPDIVVSGSWIHVPEAVTDPSAYVAHPFDTPEYWSISLRVADIDENGKPDIVLAPAHDSIGDLVWYSADEPTGTWSKHVIGQVGYVHQFYVADIDQKGRPDIVFAEMSPSPTLRVGAFLNLGAEQWDLKVIATSGSHNIVVGDLGNDCDLDIAGANWESPPVDIWENELCDGDARTCDGVANYRP
jgi:hypothetical protein